jgi:hypothetical protein
MPPLFGLKNTVIFSKENVHEYQGIVKTNVVDMGFATRIIMPVPVIQI